MITHKFSDAFIIYSQLKSLVRFSLLSLALFVGIFVFGGFTLVSVLWGYFFSMIFFSIVNTENIYRWSSVFNYHILRKVKLIQYSEVSFEKIESDDMYDVAVINITYIQDKTRKTFHTIIHKDETLYSAMLLNNSPVEIHSLAINKLAQITH
jgi:hypothetical protein